MLRARSPTKPVPSPGGGSRFVDIPCTLSPGGRMKWRLLLGAMATASAITILATAAAVAQPRVIQTCCDTISVNPPEVKVTFAVLNLGQIPICSVHFHPIQSGFTPPD